MEDAHFHRNQQWNLIWLLLSSLDARYVQTYLAVAGKKRGGKSMEIVFPHGKSPGKMRYLWRVPRVPAFSSVIFVRKRTKRNFSEP